MRSKVGTLQALCLFAAALLGIVQPAFSQTVAPGTLPSEAIPRPPTGFGTAGPRPEAPAQAPQLAIPDQAVPPGAESATFVLTSVRLDGVTVYGDGQLAPYYQGLVGSQVSLQQLFGVAREIEARYRADGYILSRAIVPAQTIDGGAFRIEIVEGFVSDVLIEGDIGPARDTVLRYLARITAFRPVNMRDLERYLLLANDVPGVRVRARFRPAEGQLGGAVLIADAERAAFDAYGEVNNRGSNVSGPVQGIVQGGANAFTSFGERTQITALSTSDFEELRFAELALEGRIGAEWLAVRGFASIADGEPGGRLKRLDIDSNATRFGVTARYPVVRTRQFSFFVKGGFDYSDLDLDASNQSLIKDRLRSLSVGVDGIYRDRFAGANAFDIGLRQGLKFLGASDNDDPFLSRGNGKVDYTRITVEASRLQGVFAGVDLFLGAKGQYSFDKLLADEEFTLGGARFGRGFDPAELAGSHGIAGTIELQYSPDIGRDLIGMWQLYGFYDIGSVWDDDDGPKNRRSLSSAGVGVRANVTDWLFLNLEAAKPLHTPGSADSSAQVFFGLAARY